MSVPRPVAASAVPSALPPALAPWAALFAEMPEPDLRVLTALVDALYPLIDRVDGAGAHPEGEIDGVGGLGSRGGIERLVASAIRQYLLDQLRIRRQCPPAAAALQWRATEADARELLEMAQYLRLPLVRR